MRKTQAATQFSVEMTASIKKKRYPQPKANPRAGVSECRLLIRLIVYTVLAARYLFVIRYYAYMLRSKHIVD